MTGVIILVVIGVLLVAEARHQARHTVPVTTIQISGQANTFSRGSLLHGGGQTFTITAVLSATEIAILPCKHPRLRAKWNRFKFLVRRPRRVWWKVLDGFEAVFPSIAARYGEKW